MKKFIIASAALSLVFLTSCGEKKESVEATEAEETATASAEAVTYAADKELSTVNWRGFSITDGVTGGHYGIVKLGKGEVSVKDGQLESGNFEVDVNTFESVDLDDDPEQKANLDGHLKTEDFLDVAKYPTATFAITEVTKIDSTDYNSIIKGNLKLREDEKNIAFKANVEATEEGVTIKSEPFNINRQDFGITFKSPKGVIKDEVELQIDVTAGVSKEDEATEGEPKEEEATEEAHS